MPKTDFYQGKRIELAVGFSPGGSYDTVSRVVADHLGRFIEGNPTIVVENRPGAASVLVANEVFRTEAQDGTVIANVNPAIAQQQALGAEGIEFDAARFQWIGAARHDIQACMVRKDKNVENLEALLADGAPEIVIGTVGPGSNTHATPALFAGVLDANIRLLPGYEGVAQIELALQNGEVDGMCVSVISIENERRHLVEGDGAVARVIGVLADEPVGGDLFQGVPASGPLAANDADRELLRVAAAPDSVAISWAVGPDVPADRVAVLRAAFEAMIADAQFKEAIDKVSPGWDASTGAEVQQVVGEILGAPPATLERLKSILAAG